MKKIFIIILLGIFTVLNAYSGQSFFKKIYNINLNFKSTVPKGFNDIQIARYPLYGRTVSIYGTYLICYYVVQDIKGCTGLIKEYFLQDKKLIKLYDQIIEKQLYIIGLFKVKNLGELNKLDKKMLLIDKRIKNEEDYIDSLYVQTFTSKYIPRREILLENTLKYFSSFKMYQFFKNELGIDLSKKELFAENIKKIQEYFNMHPDMENYYRNYYRNLKMYNGYYLKAYPAFTRILKNKEDKKYTFFLKLYRPKTDVKILNYAYSSGYKIIKMNNLLMQKYLKLKKNFPSWKKEKIFKELQELNKLYREYKKNLNNELLF